MQKIDREASEALANIIRLRRDIRGNNFKSKKIAKKKLEQIIEAGLHAPSVGYSQPWKFVIIEDEAIKNRVYKNFEKEYNSSKKHFKDRPIYEQLKLEGIKESPVNIALFYKKSKKKILGQTSQKKMGEYSVVCAIQNMWLMARSLNIGIGWVSILKAKKVKKILDVSDEYKLVGYLCVGYVKEFPKKPELQTLKWNKQKEYKDVVSWRKYKKIKEKK
jgi:5,6-dimethylbenzimidazole synthase